MDIEATNKKTISGVAWKFGERMISQGVSFLVSLILARLLMPEDYGAIAVVLIFIEIANVFVISGLTAALIQKKEISQLEISTIFYCNFFLSIILYVILFFCAPLIARIYGLPILIPVTRVIALKLPISALQAVQGAIVSRNMDFKKLFFCALGGTSTSAVIGILAAIKGLGVWALVAQTLTATVVDTVVLTFAVRWWPSLKFSFKESRSLLSYGYKVMLTDLVGTIFNQLTPLIIGIRYTSTDLAYYTKGKSLPQLIRNNIYTTLISVLFPAMSKFNDDAAQIKVIAKRSIRMLCYVIFPMMVGMAVVAEQLVIVLYTEKWLQMAPFIAIVALECMISVPPTITLQTLKAAGRGDMMLKLEAVKKPILLASLIIAMQFNVWIIALVLPINTLLDMLFNSIYSKKVIDYGILEQLKDCAPSLVLSLVMAVVVLLVGRLTMHVWLLMGLQIACGIAVYLLLSVLLKNPEFAAIKQIIANKLHKKKEQKEA